MDKSHSIWTKDGGKSKKAVDSHNNWYMNWGQATYSVNMPLASDAFYAATTCPVL